MATLPHHARLTAGSGAGRSEVQVSEGAGPVREGDPGDATFVLQSGRAEGYRDGTVI